MWAIVGYSPYLCCVFFIEKTFTLDAALVALCIIFYWYSVFVCMLGKI